MNLPARVRTSEADSSPCDVRSVGEFKMTLRACQAICDARAKEFQKIFEAN
jgi:hypothetical protein